MDTSFINVQAALTSTARIYQSIRINVKNINFYYEINNESDCDSNMVVYCIVIVSISSEMKLYFDDNYQRDSILKKIDKFISVVNI